MEKRLVLLNLLVFTLFSSVMLYAQTADELFKKAYPKFGDELKCDSTVTKLDNNTVSLYRAELNRLKNGKKDILAMQAGALTEDNTLVFEYKELRKFDDFNALKKLITDKENRIVCYMSTKTKYGADSLNCIRNIALMGQNVKQRNYADAYHYWNFLFHFYPMSSRNIYSNGVSIINFKYNKTKDNAIKNKWIDTLMMLYDQRIKYFGNNKKYNTAYILGRKGRDLLKFRKSEVETAYRYLKESVDKQGTKSEDGILLTYMQATEGMFRLEKIDASVLVDNYTKISNLLQKRLAFVRSKKNTQAALDGVDLIFSNSKGATCKNIVEAYQKKFDANKTDVALLEKIIRILNKKDCSDSPLYFNVAIELNNLKPSALASYSLARMSFKKKDYPKAQEFFLKAIKLEQVDSMKSKYYYELAITTIKTGEKVKARAYALKAASFKEGYGDPYILIATLYASSGCSTLTSPEAELPNVAYWAAVDELIKAKAIDPGITVQVNQLIGIYSSRFPSFEKAFFYNINKGDTVTIGCWINETTKARFNK